MLLSLLSALGTGPPEAVSAADSAAWTVDSVESVGFAAAFEPIWDRWMWGKSSSRVSWLDYPVDYLFRLPDRAPRQEGPGMFMWHSESGKRPVLASFRKETGEGYSRCR